MHNPGLYKTHLVSKKDAIDLASKVAEATITRSSGRRRWTCCNIILRSYYQAHEGKLEDRER